MIVLYSTNCPKCMVLEKKLNDSGIAFEINTDIDAMEKMGFTEAPMLEVDGELKDFKAALIWINSR